MTPFLYEKTYHGTGNTDRIGALTFIECQVTEERNGEFTLEGTLPAGALNVDQLAVDRIIEAAAGPKRPGDTSGVFNTYLPTQPFRIRRIWKESDDIIHVEAPHVTYQFTENIIKPTASIQDEDIQYIFNLLLNQSGSMTGYVVPSLNSAYHFVSDIVMLEPVYPNHDAPVSVRAWLGGDEGLISLLDGKPDENNAIIHPEIDWNGWTVQLKKQRGTVKDVFVTYGQNMESMQYDENANGLVTAYYGWWRKNTFTDCIIYATNKDDFGYIRTEAVDLSNEFETEPSQTEMANWLGAYASDKNANHIPTTITVTAVPDALQNVFLCDTITVVHPVYKIKHPAKVVKTVYDPIRERYTAVTIGEIETGITDTIARMLAR